MGDRGPRACRDLATREKQVPAPHPAKFWVRVSWAGTGHRGPFRMMILIFFDGRIRPVKTATITDAGAPDAPAEPTVKACRTCQ